MTSVGSNRLLISTNRTMTIALFGGTGRTGRLFLDRALDAGHSIRLLARTPSAVHRTTERITVVHGDVLDPDPVRNTVAGADVVVSLFGHVKGSPPRLQTRGTRHIVDAMRTEGVGRIISLSGGGLPFPDEDRPKIADRLIRLAMRVVVPNVLHDAIEHADVLRASGVDWVIARAPRLTDDAPTGDHRVGWVGVDSGMSIARGDLADFILRLTEDTSFDGKMPFVSG